MNLYERMMDRSILFSFDRSGFLRRQRRFDPADLQRSMRGKVCLVTGANSGLGLELARGLAEREATVQMLCRSARRGAASRDAVERQTGNPRVHLEVVDLSSMASIREFAARFAHPVVDVLIHNAGLLPLRREVTADGLELTVATHIVGPFLLNTLLRPRLKRSRVVYVSSGGMYTKRLDVGRMLSHSGPYDGVAAYAMTKRGQVVQSELWARELAGSGTVVNAMHPGWAATEGVQRSLPRFWRVMRKRLRTPAEGADTALWLAVAPRAEGKSGKFWFDRQAVPTHLVPFTRESEAERRRLWDFCEARCAAASAPASPAGSNTP